MHFLFVHSHKFKVDNEGVFYTEGQLPYKILNDRYLRYSSKLTVASRAENVEKFEGLSISSGDKVNHYILPDLSTIVNRGRRVKELKLKLIKLIHQADIIIARVPSVHARYAIKIARKLNKPYVLEVVGDPFNSLWTHGSLLGKLLAPISYIRYKKIINESNNIIYVTKKTLQKRYPPNRYALEINASNVELQNTSRKILLERINKIKKNNELRDINIGLIGSYSSKYKGIDIAIKSISELNNHGINCNLIVVGSGNNEDLVALSKKIKIDKRVFFIGSLPAGEKIFDWLDKMDLYIQPSLTEGLPRALIEAMSRGLPCVGSNVGGIPELLDDQFIHTKKSYKELSIILKKLITNQSLMLEQAERNFFHAKQYNSENLNNRRYDFWKKVLEKGLKK